MSPSCTGSSCWMRLFVAPQRRQKPCAASSCTASHRHSPTNLALKVDHQRPVPLEHSIHSKARHVLKCLLWPPSTVSDAIAMQNEWSFTKTSRLLTVLFRKVKHLFILHVDRALRCWRCACLRRCMRACTLWQRALGKKKTFPLSGVSHPLPLNSTSPCESMSNG